MSAPATAAAYAEWIAQNAGGDVRGQCARLSHAMPQDFPELVRCLGIYTEAELFWIHWWCAAPCGQIVDPTARQFPSATQAGQPLSGPRERYWEMARASDPAGLARVVAFFEPLWAKSAGTGGA